jgi:hypothetical protein
MRRSAGEAPQSAELRVAHRAINQSMLSVLSFDFKDGELSLSKRGKGEGKEKLQLHPPSSLLVVS